MWTDLEDVVLSEISQDERDKQHSTNSLTCGILKNENKKELTEADNRSVVTREAKGSREGKTGKGG